MHIASTKLTTIAATRLAPIVAFAIIIPDGAIRIMASKQGQLYFKLKRASSVTNKNRIGGSGPFVEMYLNEDYRQSSEEINGQNLIFDKALYFYVRPRLERV
ncbi:hypothetical protein BGZ58_004197, partial [Dissophora ornata]